MTSSYHVQCVLVWLLLAAALVSHADGSAVFVKLHPGRELCIAHSVFRDPEADPVKVSFTHRSLSPRLAHVKTRLFAPRASEGGGLGRELPIQKVDTFGDVTSSFFDAEETGIYRICMKTPRHHPIMSFEMSMEAANDIIAPLVSDGGGLVADKPVDMSDYATRLKMLDVCVKTTRDEVRGLQLRRYLFDEASQKALLTSIFFSVLNIAICAVAFYVSERFLERDLVKHKAA